MSEPLKDAYLQIFYVRSKVTPRLMSHFRGSGPTGANCREAWGAIVAHGDQFEAARGAIKDVDEGILQQATLRFEEVHGNFFDTYNVAIDVVEKNGDDIIALITVLTCSSSEVFAAWAPRLRRAVMKAVDTFLTRANNFENLLKSLIADGQLTTDLNVEPENPADQPPFLLETESLELMEAMFGLFLNFKESEHVNTVKKGHAAMKLLQGLRDAASSTLQGSEDDVNAVLLKWSRLWADELIMAKTVSVKVPQDNAGFTLHTFLEDLSSTMCVQRNVTGLVQRTMLGDKKLADITTNAVSHFKGRLPDDVMKLNATGLILQRLERCKQNADEGRPVSLLELSRLLKDAHLASTATPEFALSSKRLTESLDQVQVLFTNEVSDYNAKIDGTPEALKTANNRWGDLYTAVSTWSFEKTEWVRQPSMPEDQQALAKTIETAQREYTTWVNTAEAARTLLSSQTSHVEKNLLILQS